MNNRPATFILALISILVVSCVPQRKYAALEDANDKLIRQSDSLRFTLERAEAQNKSYEQEVEELTAQALKLQAELKESKAMHEKVRSSYEQLSDNYERLLKANEVDRTNLDRELRKMQTELNEKDEELTQREAELIKKEVAMKNLKSELDKLKVGLEEREQKVQELQSAISAKDSAVAELKNKLTAALLPFKESGLTVTEKNGKVYVSMEAQLLFPSGKTDIDQTGKEAILKLCESLVELQEFEIMVEGHTDDVPIKTARFEDNWDLSVLRATSIVRLMVEEGGVSPERVIPSGRSEYVPNASNESTEGREKNRRIEIILTPDLGEVMNIISD